MEVWSTFLTNLLEKVCLVRIPLRQESKHEHLRLNSWNFKYFQTSLIPLCTALDTHIHTDRDPRSWPPIKVSTFGRARTLGGAYWTEHDGYHTFYCYIGEKMLDF